MLFWYILGGRGAFTVMCLGLKTLDLWISRSMLNLFLLIFGLTLNFALITGKFFKLQPIRVLIVETEEPNKFQNFDEQSMREFSFVRNSWDIQKRGFSWKSSVDSGHRDFANGTRVSVGWGGGAIFPLATECAREKKISFFWFGYPLCFLSG